MKHDNKMDLRLGPAPRPRIVPNSREGFRAAVGQARGAGHAIDQAVSHVVGQVIGQVKNQAKDRAPQAEAAAARCVEHTRPVWSWLAREWRRLGTVAALLLIIGLLLHSMLGANGIVIYRKKRTELRALQTEVDRLQKENNQFVGQINSLSSEPAAIEKEARDELHYVRPGEIILVAPEPPQKPAVSQAQNENKIDH